MTIKRKACIAGAYEHPTRKAPDKTVAQLHAECARGALADAGLTLQDVDGYFCAGEAPGLGANNMADYLGLTIETVSRQLTKLRHAGVINIHNNRTVEVPDVERLRHLTARKETQNGHATAQLPIEILVDAPANLGIPRLFQPVMACGERLGPATQAALRIQIG